MMLPAVTNTFAEIGVMAWQDEMLPDALELLSARLDIAGAGSLLDQLMRTCWGTDRDDCPHCAMTTKGTPDPHPKPSPPPPPPPPPPPGK